MALPVLMTEDAYGDLNELYNYLAEADSIQVAETFLSRIENLLSPLARFPEAGHIPKELVEIGMNDYRELCSEPYRVIYRPFSEKIVVYLIVDGRRDMQTLLQRRLLTW